MNTNTNHSFPGKINFPNSKEIENIPLFFILGRPRSGTTLLATLFDAHPSVILPFECPYIINIYRKYSKKTLWNKTDINEFCNDISIQRGFESWRINTELMRENLLSLGPKVNFQTLVKAVNLHFQSFFKKQEICLIGDKNPIFSIYPEALQQLFPEAKFIYLTRDYRDNILSIKKVDFESPFTPLLAWRWKYVSKKINQMMARFPQQYYKIKYEDLVGNPTNQLLKLCTFLAIPFDPSVLNFHQMKDELLAKFPAEHVLKYHSSLMNPIDPIKIYGWKKNMPKRQVQLADAMVGKYAELDGYQRNGIGISWYQFPWMAVCWTYGNTLFLLRFFTDLMPFSFRQFIRTKGPLMAMVFHLISRKFRKDCM